jgi:hypothetical protein
MLKIKNLLLLALSALVLTPFAAFAGENLNANSVIFNSRFTDSNAAVPDPITVSLPALMLNPRATTVTVPITAGDLTGRNVIAFDFEVRFDPTILRPVVSEPTTKTGTLSGNFVITANPYIPGKLIVSGFGIYPISGQGTLLNLNFDVVGQFRSTSPLTWQSFMFNEGDPASIALNGQLIIRSLVKTPRRFADSLVYRRDL